MLKKVNFSCDFDPRFDIPSLLMRETGAGQVGSAVGVIYNQFTFNPSLPDSLALMTFYHVREFLENSRERISNNRLFITPESFPLRVVIIGDETLQNIEYRPKDGDLPGSRICLSVVVKGDQFMTPTIINHEYAHHVIHILTRVQESRVFDCQDPERLLCIENNVTPEAQREGFVMEGIADALAGMKSDLPVFAYYAPDLPGPQGYDISVVTGTRPEHREEVAKALWDLFLGFKERQEVEKAQDLIYRWLASNRAVQGGDRLFDGSQSLMDEILDKLDEPGFTESSDGDRNTISDLDQKVIDAFAGRKFFYAPFIRGDADQNQTVDITDPIYILGYLFEGNRDERCLDAMDVDDDASVLITDAINLLSFLFLGGGAPPAPFPSCGLDPNPRSEKLTCKEFTCPIQ